MERNPLTLLLGGAELQVSPSISDAIRVKFSISDGLSAFSLVAGVAFLSLPISGAILSLLYARSIEHNPWPFSIGLFGSFLLLYHFFLPARLNRGESAQSALWGIAGFSTAGILALPLRHLLYLNSSTWKLDLALFVLGASLLILLFRRAPSRLSGRGHS